MDGIALLIILTILVVVIWVAVGKATLQEAVDHQSELEGYILRLAMMRCGRITALDVAAHRPESVVEVERCLRRLHRDGHCESELTPDGQHLYSFPSFDDTQTRSRAIEKEILRLAKTHNGLIKVGTVALRTELSYHEAREWLEEMARQQICRADSETADVYCFPDFLVESAPPTSPQPSQEPPVAPPRPTPPEPESPFAAYTSGAQEVTGFVYDSDEESRVHQPRLPQKSGGQ